MESKYIVGIDLGTTNSIVAYAEKNVDQPENAKIQVFDIPQLAGPGDVEKRKNLPSFILMSGLEKEPDPEMQLPWTEDQRFATGEYARQRGAEIPDHLIASAKSWLCHERVDRNSPLLPWEAPENIEKLSPVSASAMILKHIKDAWNHVMADSDSALRLENQEVLLTVPASFDAVARELTVKAAEMAGLENFTLLEEPQAAFYAWIEANGDAWRDRIEKGDLVLVCDVGGGTSDFSLIRVSEENGNLVLDRISVGDHLLVGGDNMDLALAYTISGELEKKGTRLDPWQMRGLWHTCRKVKEALLTDPSLPAQPIAILGRGTRLIGGTIRAELSAPVVIQTIVDGFFPDSEMSDMPMAPQRIALQEVGLAYEADPAITRHLARFLRMQAEGETSFPTAVLFNGGVMKSPAIRERVMKTLSKWAGAVHSNTAAVREIDTDDYDLSVARGAAYYGLARAGKGIRIRGGLGKSYYIGIAAAMPAVPGMPPPMKALCIAPFGMEEGTEATLTDREFVLVVGEPVKFDLFTASARHEDTVGTIVDYWDPEEIEEMTSVETTLEGPSEKTIPVIIEIKVTEIGTLEFWCVDKEQDRRWKLEFNVREKK